MKESQGVSCAARCERLRDPFEALSRTLMDVEGEEQSRRPNDSQENGAVGDPPTITLSLQQGAEVGSHLFESAPTLWVKVCPGC